MRRALGLIVILLAIGLQTPPAWGQNGWQPHLVAVGETWAALAWRHNTSVAALQAANPHPNPLREPVIGDSVWVPQGVERNGRSLSGLTLLEMSLRAGSSPWAFSLQQGHPHPGYPTLGKTFFVAGGETPPRQLPAGFERLELSAVPAFPGEALGLRGALSRPVRGGLTLGTAVGRLHIPPDGQQLIGLIGTGAFFAPGSPELSITIEGEGLWVQPWRIATDKPWTFNQITLTGEAAQIDQAAIAAEREYLFGIWGAASPEPLWECQFAEPVTSFLSYSSFYGARRSYNGGPYRTYHEGLDYAAYGGTPVLAPASGRVVVAEQLYVRGGAVVIDHGLGVFSGYYHMSEVMVSAGDLISQGAQLGAVGTTGLSTGNHLHWDLLINGVWVDPQAWRESELPAWLLAGWGESCG